MLKPVAQKVSPGRLPGIRPFTTEGQNPKDGYGLAKVPLSLVPSAAKTMIAVGLAVGDIKYGAYNWRKTKVRLRVYIEALMRHCDELLDGEDIDPECGAPHVAMIGANFAILADAMYGGAGCVDDRPLPGLGAELIREMNDFVKELTRLTQEASNADSRTTSVHDLPTIDYAERVKPVA